VICLILDTVVGNNLIHNGRLQTWGQHGQIQILYIRNTRECIFFNLIHLQISMIKYMYIPFIRIAVIFWKI